MKLITLDQMRTVFNNLRASINTKYGQGDDAVLSSVSINNASMTYDDANHKLVVTDTDNDARASISIDFDRGDGVLAYVTDSTQDMTINSVKLKAIMDYGGDPHNNTQTVYALPKSPRNVQIAAFESGGTILTTNFRSIPITLHQVSYDPLSNDPTLLQTLEVRPGSYTIVTSSSSVHRNISIVFQRTGNLYADEYWLDITVPEGLFNIEFSEQLSWSGGEPSWNEYNGHRILVHVIYNIAQYIII